MCDLVTAFTAAMALYQGSQQRQQARRQAEYQERVAEVNARNQENEATKIRNQGVEEENRQRRMTAELLGRQRAQLGASGVVMDSGSALQLQDDTVSLGEEDALRIRGNYADQAESLETGAGYTRYEGQLQASETRNAGDAAFTAGLIGAASTALPVASKWYDSRSAAMTAAKTPSANFGNFNPGDLGDLSYG